MTRNPYTDVPDELYERLVHAEHVAPVASTGNGTCITVAAADGWISVQDSKLDKEDRHASTQLYTPAELAAFIADAKAGRYDNLI